MDQKRKFKMGAHRVCLVVLAAMIAGLAGCGGDGNDDNGLKNDDPGDNNPDVIVAFGDSLTHGNACACPSYPVRLATLTGKTVYNTGVGGTLATENIERAQGAIDRFHPAFMLILYGYNDIVHSFGVSSTIEALDQMVAICKENHVVPVLATYPEPIGDHAAYAPTVLVLNSKIRALANTHGISCVDLQPEFANSTTLLEDDGLHPNDAGTQVMAISFAELF